MSCRHAGRLLLRRQALSAQQTLSVQGDEHWLKSASCRSAEEANLPLWLLACLVSRAAADVRICDSSPIRVLLIHAIEQLQEASTDVAWDLAHHPCRHMVVPGQLCRPVVLQGISQGAAALTGLGEGLSPTLT